MYNFFINLNKKYIIRKLQFISQANITSVLM